MCPTRFSVVPAVQGLGLDAEASSHKVKYAEEGVMHKCLGRCGWCQEV